MVFTDIPVNGCFTSAIKEAEYPYKGKCFLTYKKQTKNSAICIAQEGYGNERAVGGTYSFGPFSTVYPIQ